MSDKQSQLTRRERQIMDILLEFSACSAKDIQQHIPSPPSYSAIRAMLAKLEAKGVIGHREDGAKYIYFPVEKPEAFKEGAIKRLLKVFFNNSPKAAAVALLSMKDNSMTEEDLNQLSELIEKQRRKNR